MHHDTESDVVNAVAEGNRERGQAIAGALLTGANPAEGTARGMFEGHRVALTEAGRR